jgi:polygalacturonase
MSSDLSSTPRGKSARKPIRRAVSSGVAAAASPSIQTTRLEAYDEAVQGTAHPIDRFGATQRDCARAFSGAIEAAHHSNGRVDVPAGEWHVEVPIELRSGVSLHLHAGASLVFHAEGRAYPRSSRSRDDAVPGIVARDCERIAISGPGRVMSSGRLVGVGSVSPLLQLIDCRDVLLRDFAFAHAMVDAVSISLTSCANVVIDGVEDPRPRGTFLHLRGRHTRGIRLVDSRRDGPIVRPAIVLAVDVPHDALLDIDESSVGAA